MSGLRYPIFVLRAVFVICISVVGSFEFALAESDLNDLRVTPGVKVESFIPGHRRSMWLIFRDRYLSELEFEIAEKPLAGDYLESDADIVEMVLHDAISACEQGDINLLPLAQILSDNADPSNYIGNGLQPCAVGYSVWADLIVFDSTRYIDQSAPESLQDFFDIKKFPGRRAIKRSPRVIAEWSLLMDGVSPKEIYSVLSGRQAWSRIESVLGLIDNEVIWVDTDLQALELLDKGDATFAVVSTQNLVRRITDRDRVDLSYDHYGSIWGEAIAHMSMLTLPKSPSYLAAYSEIPAETHSSPGTSSKNALEFLRYVLDSSRNLQVSTSVGYAPASRLLTEFIDEKYRFALPIDWNTDSLIWSNDKWWRESGSAIAAKFKAYQQSGPYRLKTAKISIDHFSIYTEK